MSIVFRKSIWLVVICVFYLSVHQNYAQHIKVRPVVKPQATYFPLNEVTLLDSPFKDLQQKGLDYLLWLNPDSLLHFYRIEAGLPPKAGAYAGWESQDVWGAGPLRGGFLGFYLSSVSMMYQATGNRELLKRLRYVLKELTTCQNAGKDGFLLGVKDGRELFRQVASGKIETDNPTVNAAWAPVYLINKMLLGLSAAYVQCGQKEALPIMVRLADWFGHEVLDKLTDAQIQKLLICEHGSINESYVEAYELTGQKRFLEWARRLNDEAMWIPLSQGKDILFGWHANTQIPKFTGFEKYYTFTGDKRFAVAARNFWDIVTNNHTWVIGGNSTGEHFFPKETFSEKLLQIGGPETCNSVNMLRLTEALFAVEPDAVKSAYYERVLFNHILSAYDPVKGMCCYFTPMRPGHYRIYASRDSSFWCCGHTGLESPAKLGKFIYSRQGNDLLVNLFIPSSVSWKEQGIRFVQQHCLPENDSVRFTLTIRNKKKFRLRIRRPAWTQGATLTIDGEEVSLATDALGYWIVEREWNNRNTLVLHLPMKIYTEALPGNPTYQAMLYGPYVLVGRMGCEDLPHSFWSTMDNTARNITDLNKVPTFPVSVESIPSFIKREPGQPLRFRITLNSFDKVTLEPFHKIHFERYAVYWKVNGEELKD
ncbi:beta-L-arabinofuranosidase domain-containing protein [Bacteroides sp.]